MLEVLPAGNPAEEHRFGDPPLLGPDGEVDVGDDEADQAHPREPVRHVGESPGAVAKQIRVPREQRRPHARHHQDTGCDSRQAGDDDRGVIQTVPERILARLGSGHVVAQFAQDFGLELGDVLRTHPDRPEVEPERRVNDVEDDRSRQHETGDPVPGDPGELHADDRQEGGEQQHEHRGGHHPVERPRHQRVPFDALGELGVQHFQPIGLGSGALAMGRQQHVAPVSHEEHHAGEKRSPEERPGDVGEDVLSPGIQSPPYELHLSPPRMARFTRFRISGIL